MGKKFQCLVRHYGHFYAYNHYDLESSDPDEIMDELKERGFDDALEVWDIKEQ